jgi:hypothetical protein
MLQPRPTRAPAGRLVRLSLVLDPLASRDRLVEVARMGDRAGIGALWVSDVHPLDRRPAAGRRVPGRLRGRPGGPARPGSA